VRESREDIQSVYRCWNEEEYFKVELSSDSQSIFAITKRGHFSVYATANLVLRLRWAFLTNAQLANDVVVNMVVCQLNPVVLVCFRERVRVLSMTAMVEGRVVDEEGFMFSHFNGRIIDMKVNPREDLLAVALNDRETQEPKVLLFAVDFESGSATPVSFNATFSSIRFIDFSFDNFYLMYYDDTSKKAYFINLNQKTSMYESSPKGDFYFVNEGMLHSPLRNRIKHFYHEQNQINCISRFSDSVAIVTDSFGIIRVFEIGMDSARIVQVCSQHLADVNVCKLSSDHSLLVTSSKKDKAIYVWRVVEVGEESGDE
jgi:hypothetical protein